MNFKISNLISNDKLDKDAPVIKDIFIDKNVYGPGEVINTTIKIQDISTLTEVSLGFVNDPYIGENGIDKFADMGKASLDKNGVWSIPIQLHIPNNSKNAEFKFSHVSAVDEYGNSIGITSSSDQSETFKKLIFNVTNQNDDSKVNDSILPKTGKTLKKLNLLSIFFFIAGLILILRKAPLCNIDK